MAPPDLVLHPRGGRSQSISSDKVSLTGYGGLMSPPIMITPDPAFIAASAASQIVTNDHDSQAESWLDQHGIEPSGETALVAQPALRLVNRFLDQLLYNFLAISKSTSLTSLRPAVSEVLKPKLAKGAIDGADQELHEYLGGGDDETIMAYHNGLEANGDWDLELIWKRTRLRCMVYSSLGDMEEEDEDFYTEQEHLEIPGGSNSQQSNVSGVVSPAVAIFLTSILEYIGEQVLIVAGQAAYARLKLKYEKEAKDGSITPADIADRVVVEDSDMERVALDRTLGRLWRGWKKRVRSPTNSVSLSRSFSRDSLRSQEASQAASVAPDESTGESDRRPSLIDSVLADFEFATGVPLPMNENDVREIEIPGLASQSDDSDVESSSSEEEVSRPRPSSMVIFGKTPLSFSITSLPTPTSEESKLLSLPTLRKRANSLPTPGPAPYNPSKRQKKSDDNLAETVSGESDEKVDQTQDVQDEKLNEATVSDKKDSETETSQGKIAGVIAGVATISAIAGAALAALAKGEAPQTEVDTKSEIDSDEEFVEEAEEEVQIMTSSRISIGGRISPDEVNKALSRHSSSRSQSVQSVKVIDVSRPTSALPTPELQTHRISSPILRSADASPLSRNGPPALYSRHSAGESISEEIDPYDSDREVMSAIPAELAAAMQGVDVDPSPTSQHFTSNEPSRETTPKPAAFVLAAAPPARHPQHTAKARSPVVEYQQPPAGRMHATSNPRANENGASPLTPLREMTEGAPDSSEETNSIRPSYNSRDPAEHIKGHSPSTSVSTQRAGPLRSINTNIPRESPTRSTRDETPRKISIQRSNGSGSDTASQKYYLQRASEDGSSAGDKSQSFEQLIRSDQTIQYTLTPETMRNIEALDSPNGSHSIKANTYDVPRPSTGRSRSTSASRLNGLRSNPTANSTPNPTLQARSVAGGSKLRSNVPQARDARVDRDSIGDFAEFIRSTGPANSYEQVPPRTAQTHRGTNGTARNFSGSVPRTANQPNLPRRAESSAGRKKLQARDAVVPRGDSISDLIDFVRSGPQVETNGGHRISRTVAPFRTTMDSDQMVGAVGGKAIDASFQDARYSVASNSVQSSVNSASGLLKHAAVNKPMQSQRNDFDEEDRMPKRKTRRVRDPYAIDLSDEDEDFMPAPRAKPIQEESLADFLRNVPPPPEPTTTSVFDSVPKPHAKGIKKKSSSPSLMSRFGRRDSAPAVQKPKTSSGPESRNGSRNGASTHAPITAKYHAPAPSAPQDRSYNSTQADAARSRVPRKTYQPRDAVLSSANRTNDLADFLMRSEPPSSSQTQPQTFVPTIQKEEGSAFQRMFGRKKAH
ncbi:hypothetical protein GLAREA_03402 [Glarea lozoyensis ATCC 20868]|uniref:Uncharacterized protein n=1 Tax=Glarea lozoyensis (strain ATCC 20868 / MF5171) TaxID=1116229 RepID=S3CXV7_GLAL2|nr:uncharacterized protein GLAREA_03402 [Glarea lozoyensis ATCC 20868]EPE30435.1 hypothetical protein GLAREA_03402 [Glarea lozoyensis ATCC 20868]